MKKTIINISLVIFLCAATAYVNKPKLLMKDEHTAETALDYEGTYKGVLPCADCPGIATTLTINKDNTFAYTYTYLNSEDQLHHYTGPYTLKENTLTIQVDGRPIHFFVGESRVIFMGEQHTPNTGELANHYELKKMPNTEFTYSGEYKGTYPCADCPGIETTLVLNTDKTFEYTTVYLEEKDGRFTTTGTYTVKDNVLTIQTDKDGLTHFLIGPDTLSLMGKGRTPATGKMAPLYDLKKRREGRFIYEGVYETFSEIPDGYMQRLTITEQTATEYIVDFTASKVKNRPGCSFSGKGTLKNDTLFVNIGIDGETVIMTIRPTHDGLGVDVFTKEFEERFQMMVFCRGGASLAGEYIKKTITANRIGVFNKGMTIADALHNIPWAQIQKRQGTGEFAEDVYDDYEIYTRYGKHLLTLTPRFAGSIDQAIDRVKVVSPFFTTAKGISTHATYQDINTAYHITNIEPTRTHIVLFVDEIGAQFSIPKTCLQNGWWNKKTHRVDINKIPANARIDSFIVWWGTQHG